RLRTVRVELEPGQGPSLLLVQGEHVDEREGTVLARRPDLGGRERGRAQRAVRGRELEHPPTAVEPDLGRRERDRSRPVRREERLGGVDGGDRERRRRGVDRGEVPAAAV